MGYFAQPPETVAGFVPEVCPRGEGRGALKPERLRERTRRVVEQRGSARCSRAQ